MSALATERARAPAQPRLRPPNVLAEQITRRPYLSHSQLSLMRTCPRRFELHYVERAKPEFVSASLIFGGAMHSAVELHFRCRLEGLTATPEALLLAYHDSWRRQREDRPDVPVRFGKREGRAKVDALAGRMIESFLASPLANPRGRLLGVEEELRIVLDPGLPDILARVDLVTQTEEGLHVIDFKTSRGRWTEEKAMESAGQLVLYGVTVGSMPRFLGLPVQLHFAVLTKHKIPQVQIVPVPNDADRVDTVKENVAQVWEAIQTGNFYPSPSPMGCATCAYKSGCSVFAGK